MITPDFLFDEELSYWPYIREGTDRPIYGAEQTILGRVSMKTMRCQKDGVEEVIASGKMMLPYDIQPTIDSMIRYNGIAYFVVSVAPIVGIGGCYTEVLVR